MSKFQLEPGAFYRVTIRASRLEKLLADRARLYRMLEQSGLSGAQWKSTRTGFTVQGIYTGPPGVATLPDRVTQVRRFVRPPAKL